MRVLIGCEYSGRVRRAFAARGHDVESADFEPAEDGSAQHYVGDVFDLLGPSYPKFDLMIAHPPCTYLCNSGVRWLYEGGKQVVNSRGESNWDRARLKKMHEAVDFFVELERRALASNPKMMICRENPVMHTIARSAIGPAAQFIQPWMFGDPFFKATGLWLTNLDPLEEDPAVSLRDCIPNRENSPEQWKKWSAIHRASPGKNRWKERSRTFEGIAEAMAKQWG